MREEYRQSLQNIKQETERITNELNLLPINNIEVLNKLKEIELNEQFKNKENMKYI